MIVCNVAIGRGTPKSLDKPARSLFSLTELLSTRQCSMKGLLRSLEATKPRSRRTTLPISSFKTRQILLLEPKQSRQSSHMYHNGTEHMIALTKHILREFAALDGLEYRSDAWARADQTTLRPKHTAIRPTGIQQNVKGHGHAESQPSVRGRGVQASPCQ